MYFLQFGLRFYDAREIQIDYNAAARKCLISFCIDLKNRTNKTPNIKNKKIVKPLDFAIKNILSKFRRLCVFIDS